MTLHGTLTGFVHFQTPLEYSHHLHQCENTGHQRPDKLTNRPDSPDPTHTKTGKHVSPPTFASTHGSGNERLRTDQTHVPKSQEWQSGCRHLPLEPVTPHALADSTLTLFRSLPWFCLLPLPSEHFLTCSYLLSPP